MANATARQVQAAYSEARGRAMSLSTRRLRWWARRLPANSTDERVMAERKAISDELRQRGGTE